jgi:hypothetical protein
MRSERSSTFWRPVVGPNLDFEKWETMNLDQRVLVFSNSVL